MKEYFFKSFAFHSVFCIFFSSFCFADLYSTFWDHVAIIVDKIKLLVILLKYLLYFEMNQYMWRVVRKGI